MMLAERVASGDAALADEPQASNRTAREVRESSGGCRPVAGSRPATDTSRSFAAACAQPPRMARSWRGGARARRRHRVRARRPSDSDTGANSCRHRTPGITTRRDVRRSFSTPTHLGTARDSPHTPSHSFRSRSNACRPRRGRAPVPSRDVHASGTPGRSRRRPRRRRS